MGRAPDRARDDAAHIGVRRRFAAFHHAHLPIEAVFLLFRLRRCFSGEHRDVDVRRFRDAAADAGAPFILSAISPVIFIKPMLYSSPLLR